MKVLGIILIIVGILMLVVPGINVTHKEEVLDIGPVEINKTEKERVGWPKYAGGIAVVAGIIVLVAGSKKKN